MSKLRSDWIVQGLTNLGIIAPGQSISPEAVAKMDSIVDPVVAELERLQIYYVSDPGALGPNDGAIDDDAFLYLADYLANRSCSAFNLPADQKLMTLATIAEARLITMTAPSRTRRTLRIDPALTPNRGYYRGGI